MFFSCYFGLLGVSLLPCCALLLLVALVLAGAAATVAAADAAATAAASAVLSKFDGNHHTGCACMRHRVKYKNSSSGKVPVQAHQHPHHEVQSFRKAIIGISMPSSSPPPPPRSLIFHSAHRDDSESLSLSTTATSARSPSPSPTSPARGMERRGSRARRRLLSGLTVDTALGGFGVGEEEDPPAVIDTTSVEVERKADGKPRGTQRCIHAFNLEQK